MPKFVIEREISGAGSMSVLELQGVAEKSCSVLLNLGPQIQWLESYVTQDKGAFCKIPFLNAIKRQGTTSVVLKEEQKVTWALALEILFLAIYNSAAAEAGIVFGTIRHD